jgi:2,3-bisphosphoglycerate-dependent phosphoglycerate mutase
LPRLILVRHGQSQWNLENRFTGWWDVDLTAKGEAEARAAGALMAAKGVLPSIAFTSLQTRAIRTLHLALEAMGRLWIPEVKDWRLNERHYGGLTGLDKAETAARHGEDQVRIWRRSFDTPPPVLEPGSAFDLAADPRYAGIAIPSTESLKDTIARVLPDRGARQFAARAGQAPVRHFRRRHHRAGDPDRPADRLRARRRPRGARTLLSGGAIG